MSDSFDLMKQLEALTKETKIRLELGLECNFGTGWFGLLQELVEEIQHLTLQITDIDTSHGQLDVRFFNYEDNNADDGAAWIVVQEKRLFSRNICSECGKFGSNHTFSTHRPLLCQACEKETSGSGRTGTWLDQY